MLVDVLSIQLGSTPSHHPPQEINIKVKSYKPSTTVSSKWSPHQSLSRLNSFSVAFVLTKKQTKNERLK